MSYVAPYIDDAGLHLPTYVDIRDDLIANFKQIYGEDVYLEYDSQDYQMISAFALKTYDTMQLLQIVYNNHSPKTAVGTGLSNLVKLNGIVRKSASYSTCVLTLKGTPGTTIAAGVCEDSAGVKWYLPENVKLTLDTVEVTAKCEKIGAVEAATGTITKINTPQKGWISVTNKVPAVKGQPVETDEELRARQSVSVALPAKNMLNATIAGLKAISGVSRVKVYDNDSNVTDDNGIPGHSIAAVVEGGLDSAVAETIYLRKGAGGGTYGTSTVVFKNDDGLSNNINFCRPTYTAIDVSVEITKTSTYTETVGAAIKSNIEDYLAALDIGDDVTVIGVLTAITSVVSDTTIPSFSLKSVKMRESGGLYSSADIAIAFNAIAKAGDINVEVGS